MKVQYKPVIEEARQLTDTNAREIDAWCNGLDAVPDLVQEGPLAVILEDGLQIAEPGDWIIQGPDGSFYVQPEHIFNQTRQVVSDDSDDEDPYCPVCGSCGDDGCCSPLMCAYKHMVEAPRGMYCAENYKSLHVAWMVLEKLTEDMLDQVGFQKILDKVYNPAT